MTGADVVTAARSLLGTPYVPQGRVPGVGTDCLGVLILVARLCGFKPAEWDVNGYSMQPDGSLLPLLDEHADRVTEPRHGDMLAVSWGHPNAHHVGILAPHSAYAGQDSIIHAFPKAGKVVEHRLKFGKFMQLRAVYRFRGLSD